MFDTKEGNALQELAANGASPNAFTSNAITGYYFESTEKFEENLRILLSFVSIPYFTKESVDKEQGIIGQEIGMIEDDPDWRGLYGSDAGPVREAPGAGVAWRARAESISHITAETLYACHKAFYDPSNMVLCVAGDVDPEKICARRPGRSCRSRPGAPVAQRDYGAQPRPTQVCSAHDPAEEMEVSVPLFQLGYQGGGGPRRERRALRQQLLGELACGGTCWAAPVPLYARAVPAGAGQPELQLRV